MKFNGDLLRKLREGRGLSQEALALSVGKTRQTVANWENGVNDPSFEDVGKLGSALGVSGTFFIQCNNAA